MVRDPSQSKEPHLAPFHGVEMLRPFDNLEVDLEAHRLQLLLNHLGDQLIASPGGVELQCDLRQALSSRVSGLRQQLPRTVGVVRESFYIPFIAWQRGGNGALRCAGNGRNSTARRENC